MMVARHSSILSTKHFRAIESVKAVDGYDTFPENSLAVFRQGIQPVCFVKKTIFFHVLSIKFLTLIPRCFDSALSLTTAKPCQTPRK